MTEKCKWLRIVGGILVLLDGLFAAMNIVAITFANHSIVSHEAVAGSVFSALWQLSVTAFVAVSLFIGRPKLIAAALSVNLVLYVVSGAFSRISMLISGVPIPVVSNVIYAVTTLLSVTASVLMICALFICEKRNVPLALWIVPIILCALLGLRGLVGGTYGNVASFVYNLMLIKGSMSMNAILNTSRFVSFVLFVPALFKSVCAAVWGLVNCGRRD